MIFYVDGACQGNGKEVNKGGFGVVVLDNDKNFIKSFSKLSDNTSNNREEMKAILFVLNNYGVKINKEDFMYPEIPVVYSDSNYSIQTFTNWMFNWERNNWIKSDKKQPENLDLIKEYFNLYQKGYRIELKKVKGHDCIKGNELADRLATGKIKTIEESKLFWDTYVK